MAHLSDSPLPCLRASGGDIQELVQELVLEVQMASSRTSVLELRTSSRITNGQFRTSSRTEVLEPAICTSRASS